MTPTELNRQFAIANALRFETAGGLTRAVISTPLTEGEIYQQGAHIARWNIRGRQPVLFLSSKSSFAPGKPIRGGVPIIFPWFGPRAGDPGAPMHGVARTAVWDVESARQLENGAVEIALGLSVDACTLRFIAAIGSELTMTLHVANHGHAPLAFEEALHTYFAVSDVREVAIHGLEGTAYIDKTDGLQRKVQPDAPIRIAKETDQIHLNCAGPCVVSDIPGGRRIVIRKTGSNSSVVWNPWIEKAATLADMAPGEWQGMVCVESGNIAENAVTLAAGESHRMTVAIGVE